MLRRSSPYQLPQYLQPLQQAAGSGLIGSQSLQNLRFALIHAPLLQIVTVSHKVDDAVHAPVSPLGEQVGHMGLEGLALAAGPGGCTGERGNQFQNGRGIRTALGRRLFGCRPADPCPQLVVDPQEGISVPGVLGQSKDIHNIPHHPVGKETAVHLAAAVGDALTLQ